MSFVQHVQAAVQIPIINVPVSGASLTTLAAAFLEQIHGPAATVGVILGIAWVVLQAYLAIEKRWFRKET